LFLGNPVICAKPCSLMSRMGSVIYCDIFGEFANDIALSMLKDESLTLV
jgi:hypothetical protein